MNFIELTDRHGDKITINFDRIESFTRADSHEKFTRLDFINDTRDCYIFVKETYEQIKEMLNVR